ncbi:MAG TPA: molybdopterin-dependent oxidoreductase [Thermoanaerobaculia bacterium]|nr:molybdopterin-dependent oxidoreductase [Thermoanaerobaculia bacterium]
MHLAMSPTTPETATTYCPLDCPDSCSLTVQIEDGRLTKLDGDHRNPVTAGFICTKVRHYPEHVYGPHRLRQPALREGAKGQGNFRPVSWDEALGRIAERIGEARHRWGGEAILPFFYGGSNGLLTQGAADARLFRRLGSSRLARTVCAAPTTRIASAFYGRMPGVAYPDFAEAKLIVIWGQNPSASSIHLVPYVLEAQKRGARLVVVDPRRIPLATKADLHLALRPGTDVAVALALHRHLFTSGAADRAFLSTHAHGAEELERRASPWTFERAAEVSGVPAADLEQLARLYAESSPALVRCGWGPERNRNGGSAVAAILALPAVGGKFGVVGGGYTMSNSGAWNLDASAAVAAAEPATRLINMNHLGRTLLEEEDPPVGVLFVYNANPLATLPDQERVRRGLAREDLFTVVFDAVHTDTARYADVLLPATTFLEHEDLSRGYGSYVAQRSRPVIEPVGEARPNHAVFLELVHRLGLYRPGDVEDLDGFARAALERNGRAEEIAASFAARGLAETDPVRPVQMVNVFPRTSDGKIHLLPPELDREAPAGLYGYQSDPATEARPLALISPATSRTVSSTLGELDRRTIPLEMHPDDAAARGLTDGEVVRVWNELGEVRCLLKVSREVRPGVVFLPKGLWSHHTLNGLTSNALTPDTLTDVAGGACFNDARVEVGRG